MLLSVRSELSPASAWRLLLLSLFQDMINRQMNSVFKELLSRQPPVQASAFTAPAAPSSSSSSSLPQSAPAAKKVGFGIRGRALFRPVDWEKRGRQCDDYTDGDDDDDDAFGEDPDLFFATCIIFGSLPSHSATSLSAVFLYVQCDCFPAGLYVSVCLQRLENQGHDITSENFSPSYFIENSKRLKLPPSGRSEISSHWNLCFG